MNNSKMMGFETPDDKKVPVLVRDWNGMKRALWRSRYAWELALKEATNLLHRCAHMEGCPATADDDVACLPDCPDRELRMSALVILNAARQFAPLDARSVGQGPYFAPSREGYSETMAELAACQTEIEMLDPDGSRRAALRVVSTDPVLVDTVAAPQLQEKTP
jgi:hypothetical protein